MTEGDAAKIARSTSSARRGSPSARCSSLFELTTSGWMTWYTKSDRYSRSKLNADLETLARVLPEPRLPRVQRRIDAGHDLAGQAGHHDHVSIHEGQPYTVTAVRLEGDYLGKEDEFKSLVTVKPGAAYDGDAVSATTKRFGDRSPSTATRSRASSRGPRSTARPAASWWSSVADPQRRVYVRRINDRRQHAHPRRSRAARIPPARVVLVRRRAHQAVARPGRPPGLLQGRHRRHERGAGLARPGRPGRARRGKADRQPDGRRRLLERRQAVADGVDQAGQRVRLGQLPGLRDQHQQEPAIAGHQHRSTRTSRRRHLARDRPLLPHEPTVQQPGRGATSSSTPGASVRFGVPFSEYDTVFFGVGAERTDISATTGMPN